GDGLSRFKSLLIKLEEKKELYVKPLVFYVSRTGETNLSEIKQVDQFARALSSIPAIVDRYTDNKLGEAINKAIQGHNFDCRKEAQVEKRERRIIVVTRLKIMKKYDYIHLEEIEVRRDDQELYTFKEGDFKRLNLQDIKDMLLLLVQQRLTNLTIDKRCDLNVALCMYTRRIVIQRKAALSEEINVESREVRWWKGIRE
nr:hypothetical protein [Tanacetum cinerariifolium]